eukprot:6181114-Pleurochrysis_carterae.AAC.1
MIDICACPWPVSDGVAAADRPCIPHQITLVLSLAAHSPEVRIAQYILQSTIAQNQEAEHKDDFGTKTSSGPPTPTLHRRCTQHVAGVMDCGQRNLCSLSAARFTASSSVTGS